MVGFEDGREQGFAAFVGQGADFGAQQQQVAGVLEDDGAAVDFDGGGAPRVFEGGAKAFGEEFEEGREGHGRAQTPMSMA